MFDIDKIYVPPIKIQGIKTKIIPLISKYVDFEDDSVWLEPFMGSGVVGFNVAPHRAIFADINPHTINFYNSIKSGKIDHKIVRDFLEIEGKLLCEKDEEYYYAVRTRFNEKHDPLDFLFLNRSCFNGMIRFNKDNKFNVPYGHKPERFAKSYVTKIVNQVKHIENLLNENDWAFKCQSFEATIAEAKSSDFIYCDPPYIGRHVDYFDSWDELQEYRLHDCLVASGAKFMISTWDYNQYRKNDYIEMVWSECHKINKEHFYHVGATEEHRNSMMEALLTNYTLQEHKAVRSSYQFEQLALKNV